MQIGRFGFTENEAAIAAGRDAFICAECAIFHEFLAPDLAQRFSRDLDVETSAPAAHYFEGGRELGRDISFSSASVTLHALHLLLNNPRLFTVIERITGSRPIGCFSGRIYRNLPTPAHQLDWHDDTQIPGRLIGLTINLSPGALEGGEFRLRRKSTRETLAEVALSNLGNAHIFHIDTSLEHCVMPVRGRLPRTALAGWFQSAPDYRTFVQGLFGSRRETDARDSVIV
jgi:hypothetical protein